MPFTRPQKPWEINTTPRAPSLLARPRARVTRGTGFALLELVPHHLGSVNASRSRLVREEPSEEPAPFSTNHNPIYHDTPRVSHKRLQVPGDEYHFQKKKKVLYVSQRSVKPITPQALRALQTCEKGFARSPFTSVFISTPNRAKQTERRERPDDCVGMKTYS